MFIPLSAETLEGRQILVLIEPDDKSFEKPKTDQSNWDITNPKQRKTYSRILNRSKEVRSRMMKSLFPEVQNSTSSEKYPASTEIPTSPPPIVPKNVQRYFEIYNQDWRRTRNEKFSPNDFGSQKTTPARFLEVPEYHFNKDANPEDVSRSYIRSEEKRKGADRFQGNLKRLFKKPVLLATKQNYQTERDATKIKLSSAKPSSKDNEVSFSRRETLKSEKTTESDLVMINDSSFTNPVSTLDAPKHDNSLWSVGVGVRSGRDRGVLKTYRNEVSLQLARNTSKGDQWFMEWARANHFLTNDSKFETLGIGFKKFYKGYDDERQVNPYIALMVENWRGKLNQINGVNLREGSQNKLIPVARVGMEYKINDVSNLDLHINSGGNYMKFTDTNGQNYEVKSHHSSVGMGVNYEF